MKKLKEIKKELALLDVNVRGGISKQKIIVFESDDWGSERMPSLNTYYALLKNNIPVDKSVYCKYDTLELNEDIQFLSEELHSFGNKNIHKPIFTLNFVSGNPDFLKIKEAQFEQYFFESIIKTYKKYSNSDKVLDLIFEGMKYSYFTPQFHGRDHVNVPLWMGLLRTNSKYKTAFEYGMWGLSNDVMPEISKSIQATYDSLDYNYTSNSIKEGLETFEKIFDFSSKTFIANNYIWSDSLLPILQERGIIHLQTMKYQLLPLVGDGRRKKIRRPYGSKNKYGMTYAPRNCTFEPSIFGETHLDTLRQIKRAFFYKKPAIISTHRINFVGRMNVFNRDKNLIELRKLLFQIYRLWPDVIFLSSDQLHGLIQNQATKIQ